MFRLQLGQQIQFNLTITQNPRSVMKQKTIQYSELFYLIQLLQNSINLRY